MQIWEMTQTEFVGPAPPGGRPAATANNWADLSAALLSQMFPNVGARMMLTGHNSQYSVTPVLSAPDQFLAEWHQPTGFVPVGLYSDTLIVLDPLHARRWIAEELVIAAWSVRACLPDMQRTLTTASEKTFKRAHELATRRAHARLDTVHQASLGAYQLPNWP